MDSNTNPIDQLRQQLKELREIVKNFRVVGVGVAGSFEKGYSVRQPEVDTTSSEE